MKIGFAASSGGHLEQLMMLKTLMEKYPSFTLTEKGSFLSSKTVNKKIELKQINRKEKFFLFKFLIIFLKSYKIYKQEKPDLIITTGALITIPIALITKIHGGKIIYIESFAKIDSLTITGKIMYKIADEFIVQWPNLKDKYSNAVYGGGIY